MEREALLLLGGNLGERELNIRRAVERLGEVAGRVVACSSLYESEPWGFESDHSFLNCAVRLVTELTPYELLESILKCEVELGRVREVDLSRSDKVVADENNFKSFQKGKDLASVEKTIEKTEGETVLNSEESPEGKSLLNAEGKSQARGYRSRTIDIDIIFYDNEVVETQELTMTHPLTIPHPLMAERRFVLEPLAEIAPDFIHPILKKSVAQLLSECSDPLACHRFSSFTL